MSLPEVLIFDGTHPPLLPPSSVLVSPTLSPSQLQLWSLRPTAPYSQCFSRPRPSGLTQPACCRLSAPPRPRGCFKITTIPLSLPCPFFHYWKTKKQKQNKTQLHEILYERAPAYQPPPPQTLSRQSRGPVSSYTAQAVQNIVSGGDACLPQRKRGGQRATFRALLSQVMQRHPQSRLGSR